jgi:hypothetical protein
VAASDDSAHSEDDSAPEHAPRGSEQAPEVGETAPPDVAGVAAGEVAPTGAAGTARDEFAPAGAAGTASDELAPAGAARSASEDPRPSAGAPDAADDTEVMAANTDPDEAAVPDAAGPDEAGPDEAAGPPRGGWFRRGRLGFRGWRRTRPFWGGLIALLGGIEILLSERAPVAVVVHLGAQGLAGYVVPVVLVLCALLLWFNPAQRIFYSILAVLAALASFITSNLGGFVLGMLLGIVGGSLAFAWVPGEPPRPRRRRRERPIAARPSEGLALVVGDRERQAVAPHGGDAETGPAGDPEPGPGRDPEPGPGSGLQPGRGSGLSLPFNLGWLPILT